VARGKLKVKKREIRPDEKYKRTDISKFINKMMLRGQKSTARILLYKTFEIVEKNTKKDPLEVYDQAMRNISPILEVRPKRIGGAAYQIPVEVLFKRKQHLAFKWMITAARTRKGKSFSEKLAEEIIDAYNSTGGAFKKKEDTHRMAEANKALAYLAKMK